MKYQPQVSKEHYTRGSYRVKERWISYWYQLAHVRMFKPNIVLEIGVGDKTVSEALRKDGIEVTTMDIDATLHPDINASVESIPCADNSFDVVLAAEVLEHVRFEDVERALKEFARVARQGVVIGLPHSGWTFSFECKIPLMSRVSICLKIPHFWKLHVFNGEHYWELGKRHYSVKRFIRLAESAGLTFKKKKRYADDPAHIFFTFLK